MLLVPEPPRDIEAQLLAAIDVDHPKRACFCVPADQYLIPPSIDAYVVRRPEGSLVTLHKRLAEAFERSADDTSRSLRSGARGWTRAGRVSSRRAMPRVM
jgi:hypothetical protein